MKTVPNVALYLDMDGVLVDFDKRAMEIYPKFAGMADWFHRGIGSKSEYTKLYTGMLFKIMRTKDFWINLPWTQDGKELFNYVEKKFHSEQVGILTAPMNQDPRCEPEKWEWVQRHLKIIPKKLFFCSINKEQYVGRIPGKLQILIDDREKNITAWRHAGGIGIYHKSAGDSIRQLEEIILEAKERS